MESSIEFLEASSLRAVSETAAPASEKGMSEEMTEDEQGQGGLSQRRSPQNPRPARVAVCGKSGHGLFHALQPTMK